MAKQYDLVYLDACVIIDILDKNPEHYCYVEPLIREAEAENLNVLASVVCISEVFMIKGKSDSEATTLIDAFFDQEYVHLYDVDDYVARKSVSVRRNANLETADALHVATAIAKGAQAFITRDGDGKKAKKGAKKTILELKDRLNSEIDILTPKEFFEFLSSEVKQINIRDENDKPEGRIESEQPE